MRVAELPEKTQKHRPHYQGLNGCQNKQRLFFGDGSFGGEYVVSDDIMNELFLMRLYEDVLHYLKFE